MKLRYFGHSAFQLTLDNCNILIDPFLKGNPFFDENFWDNLDPDFILVTHGHADHLGDTIELAKKHNATVIAPFELANYIATFGVNIHPMHIGGSFDFPFGTVKLTIAVHGSAVLVSKTNNIIYTGNPCGYIISTEGKTIYHAGDTGLFYDMKLIGELFNIDYALLPIGGNFTMNLNDTKKAMEFLNAKYCVPMHFNTFDVIKVPDEQIAKLRSQANFIIMEPNNEIKI